MADTESAALFKPLFEDATTKHDVAPGQLTLHADCGPSMKAKATALLLADLGVAKSHSRPYTSNDNPFSEELLQDPEIPAPVPKTVRLHPGRQGLLPGLFDWYNQDHHRLGIGLMTPDQVHYGQGDDVYAARQKILDQVFQANPNRFVNKPPQPPAVWINPPNQKVAIQA